ncbi:MAG: glycosyltransferase [Bacilli bacterium]|nr:glycosyltransferase [Bacilli bacterium]
MKIAVYAICKNEEKFVERFMENAKEADAVYVLDTGSTDNTVEKLKECGAIVKQKKYDFFRFDIARNDSLDMIPSDYDICVCLDLDEVIMKGWRKKLESIWKDDTTRLRYNYNWRLEDNVPIVNFYIEKIHKRKGYTWKHPVHEVLYYDDMENFITTDEITINHYPDNEKSRGSYLPLLELSVSEDPINDRNMHYLGREYMYYGKYQECIDTLIKHLNLESATWKDERCASMRFIARCYKYLKRYDEANMWLEKAIKEAPYLRDPYVEMIFLQYELQNFDKIIENGEKALLISKNPKSYINEVFSYNETIYDYLSIAYYYKNNKEKALENVLKALEINPIDERILKNKELIMNM